MNIFQKIGNNIEKEKLKRKKFEDNYWKLFPIERIEYDNKLRKIESEEIGFIPKFYTTKIYLGIIIFFTFILFGLYFSLDYDLNKYITFLRGISLQFMKSLMIAISLDFLIQFIGLGLDKTGKKKKELNKRFKL